MQVYQTNQSGIFVGAVTADPDPLEPSKHLIPAGCVTAPPPTIPQGFVARWSQGAWVLENASTGEQVPPGGPTPDQLRATMQLSFAQLLIGLVGQGWITEAEGSAWLSGTLPAAVEALIATLPSNQRFPARARASRPSVVMRLDPLVIALATAQGKSAAELDAFFVGYASA